RRFAALHTGTRTQRVLEACADAGHAHLTVHVESDDDRRATLKAIGDVGVKAGVVLNPATPFKEAAPHLEHVELLLVMTVQPGFAGQAFRRDVLPKIREARAYIDKEDLACELQVDGGIKVDTAPPVAEAAADILVSGSGIFPDRVAENLRALRDAASKGLR